MRMDYGSFGKAFAPRVLTKALRTFDGSLMIIVSVCWGGALLVMLFALYTVHLSVVAKREVVEAAATAPALPQMSMGAPNAKEMTPIMERLQKRFPDLSFTLEKDLSLSVSAADGTKFRTWLTVLSYVDTISPQYRWQIADLCVGGQCGSSALMRANLLPKKITFTAPESKGE